MAKILHLEIESCEDCPYAQVVSEFDWFASCILLFTTVYGGNSYNGRIKYTAVAEEGILPNCPLEEKKDHA